MRIDLFKDKVFCIDVDARGVSINCDRGSLWVTQPNDNRDHILRTGKTVHLTQKGKVVVFAFMDSVLSVSKTGLDSTEKVRASALSLALNTGTR